MTEMLSLLVGFEMAKLRPHRAEAGLLLPEPAVPWVGKPCRAHCTRSPPSVQQTQQLVPPRPCPPSGLSRAAGGPLGHCPLLGQRGQGIVTEVPGAIEPQRSAARAGIRCRKEKEAFLCYQQGPGGRGQCAVAVGSECRSLREHR